MDLTSEELSTGNTFPASAFSQPSSITDFSDLDALSFGDDRTWSPTFFNGITTTAPNDPYISHIPFGQGADVQDHVPEGGKTTSLGTEVAPVLPLKRRHDSDESDPPARVLRSRKRAKTVKSSPDTLSSQVQTIKLSTLKARLGICKDKLLQIEADLANIGRGELKLSTDE
ncbi:MAG: hypothetical protein L6R37_007997 [Teloschistes peruensis]|nr:MAG: hypothetical protein L6R37_007997 [Teloschistes peruensis]